MSEESEGKYTEYCNEAYKREKVVAGCLTVLIFLAIAIFAILKNNQQVPQPRFRRVIMEGTGDSSSSGPVSDFKPSKDGSGYGVQPIDRLPGGGDVHDTFRVDQQGNVSGGHTTIQLPGQESLRLPWPKQSDGA